LRRVKEILRHKESLSFELNSRAGELQIFIRELSALVGGNIESDGMEKAQGRSSA
jgi:hypothetical protein